MRQKTIAEMVSNKIDKTESLNTEKEIRAAISALAEAVLLLAGIIDDLRQKDEG